MIRSSTGITGIDRQQVGCGTENAHSIKGNTPAFNSRPKSGRGFNSHYLHWCIYKEGVRNVH